MNEIERKLKAGSLTDKGSESIFTDRKRKCIERERNDESKKTGYKLEIFKNKLFLLISINN